MRSYRASDAGSVKDRDVHGRMTILRFLTTEARASQPLVASVSIELIGVNIEDSVLFALLLSSLSQSFSFFLP
jgi:hypothetical protein